MHKTKLIQYGSDKVTRLVLYSSLGVSIVLTALLIIHDLANLPELRTRTHLGIGIIFYIGIACLLAYYQYLKTVSWMLIILYTSLAFAALLYWGLHAAIGLFASSFVIMLAGVLLGSRAALPTSLTVVSMLFITQFIHATQIISPNLERIPDHPTLFDVVSYVTILGVFSLITWMSDRQREKTLQRALSAEEKVRAQKNIITQKLEKQSARLRQTQLKEMQQLYKFATLGQSTAATLHELSNHLSILNLDIDDIKQQHKNSQAIENAQEGIEHINLMVRQIRRKMNSYDDIKPFRIDSVIHNILKDQSDKFKVKQIQLRYTSSSLGGTKINGDPLALTQIITVLISNALDACCELPSGKVIIQLENSENTLHISIIDNGIGISESIKSKLFSPTLSSKPAGLGVGLYIARHLAESQFQGSLIRHPTPKTKSGAHFILKVPIYKKG